MTMSVRGRGWVLIDSHQKSRMRSSGMASRRSGQPCHTSARAQTALGLCQPLWPVPDVRGSHSFVPRRPSTAPRTANSSSQTGVPSAVVEERYQ